VPWKDSLALWILSNPSCDVSYDVWKFAKSKFTRVMVKTVDVKRRVVNIQLEQHGLWFKPTEWANNHIQSLWSRVNDDIGRILQLQKPTVVREELSILFPDLDIRLDLVEKMRTEVNDLNSRYNEMAGRWNKLVEELGTSKALVMSGDEKIARLKKGLRGARDTIRNNSNAITPKPIKDLVEKIDSLLAKS